MMLNSILFWQALQALRLGLPGPLSFYAVAAYITAAYWFPASPRSPIPP